MQALKYRLSINDGIYFECVYVCVHGLYVCTCVYLYALQHTLANTNTYKSVYDSACVRIYSKVGRGIDTWGAVIPFFMVHAFVSVGPDVK